jgi:hypothetical protein
MAGSGGSISGIQLQTVDHDSNGCPVMAIADANHHFVNWSDGSTDNPRSDLNVTGNVTVTANFAINTDLENWRVLYFETRENAGIAADNFDADLDGLANLLEYATGSDPTTPNPSPLKIGLASVGTGLELTFNRIADPALNYVVRGKNELGPGIWGPIWSGTGTNTGTVRIPETQWPSKVPRYFFRLEVGYQESAE